MRAGGRAKTILVGIGLIGVANVECPHYPAFNSPFWREAQEPTEPHDLSARRAPCLGWGVRTATQTTTIEAPS